MITTVQGLQGFKEIDKTLRKFGEDIRVKYSDNALRAAARVYVTAVERGAASRSKRYSEAYYKGAVPKPHFAHNVAAERYTRQYGDARWIIGIKKALYWLWFIEHGWSYQLRRHGAEMWNVKKRSAGWWAGGLRKERRAAGRKIPGQEFIKRAFYQGQEEASKAAFSQLAEDIRELGFT